MTSTTKATGPRAKPSHGLPLPGLLGARQGRALSQRGLALLAGVDSSTIVDLEAGRRGAYPVTVRKLAAALGVSPAALYGQE